jgi:hypothetical protein
MCCSERVNFFHLPSPLQSFIFHMHVLFEEIILLFYMQSGL